MNPKPDRGGLRQGQTGSRSIGPKLGGDTTGLSAAPVNGVNASGTLTVSDQPSADDTMTIGSITYTFVSGTPGENEIQIGGDTAATQANILAALASHPEVTPAESWSTNDLTITAKTEGVAGNSIATTDEADNVSFAEVNLTGGVTATVRDPESFHFYSGTLYYTPDGSTWYEASMSLVS